MTKKNRKKPMNAEELAERYSRHIGCKRQGHIA